MNDQDTGREQERPIRQPAELSKTVKSFGGRKERETQRYDGALKQYRGMRRSLRTNYLAGLPQFRAESVIITGGLVRGDGDGPPWTRACRTAQLTVGDFGQWSNDYMIQITCRWISSDRLTGNPAGRLESTWPKCSTCWSSTAEKCRTSRGRFR